MKRMSIALMIAMMAGAAGIVASQQDDRDLHGQPEPPDAKVHHARGNAGSHGGGGSPLLTYHGGPVMTTGAHVQPIFWGTSWNNAQFLDDKEIGLQSFYSGMGASSYEATNTEYTQGNGTHVGTGITVDSSIFDFSGVPRRIGNSTSPILAEVCSKISNPQANGYYPVYVDTPRGHAGFCAWHSTGTCNGVQVQFAFFFNLDGDPGCDPQDPASTHSQGLEALANVSGHELSETLTDQHLDAWTDASGAENSDKCAWSFGSSFLTFTNNSTWKVQGNWSNAAFNDPTRGYPNSSGQKGCIDGGNYK